VSDGGRPTGTLTFLFTDMEGSTRLLQELPDDYPVIVETQRRLIRDVVRERGGHEFGTGGDAVFVAFERASSAVAAAVDSQRVLGAHAWPAGATVKVRMGLHTGDVQVVDDDYVGLALHVAARICTAGHGGQVLLSAATQQLAPDATVVDLGAHRLRDVRDPVTLFMATGDGVESDFPPPRTLSALPNNLPSGVDEFVGRRQELVDVVDALSECRLVSLVGPGGMGKTRLALEAASAVLPLFADGAWLVELASVTRPAQVISTVAAVLGIDELAAEPIEVTLLRYLGPRDLLLVVDNCEHLVEGVAGFVDAVLAGCSKVKVLATTRELLGVRGEHAVALPPLDAASDLFVARARAVAPAFDPDAADAETIVSVCERLDRMPLAIELAAARLRTLSLPQLAARLDDRFRLLTGGARTALPRQRTLEAVVAWSHDLLSETERTLFRRLSVFPDSFDLDGAAALAGDYAGTVLDGISSLAEKSLLASVPSDDDYRYLMLETLRQYGRERLAEAGEADECHNLLVDWARHWADRLNAAMRTPSQDALLRAALREQANLRLAFDYALETGDDASALRIVSAAPIMLAVARRTALESLINASGVDELSLAHALSALSNVAFEQGDATIGIEASTRARDLFSELGERRHAVWAQYFTLIGHWALDPTGLDTEIEKVVHDFRDLEDELGLAYTLWMSSLLSPDPEVGDARAAEAEAMFRRLGAPIGLAHDIEGRAIMALRARDPERAAPFLAEALDIFAEAGNPGCSAHTIEGIAAALVLAGNTSEAAALLGAGEELRRISGHQHRPWERIARDITETALAGLDLETERAEGHAMTFHEAVARARVSLTGVTRITS
jgi:predicted ATPase/class 3 adenylate cyclase